MLHMLPYATNVYKKQIFFFKKYKKYKCKNIGM